jgi:hypothetical protein
MSDRYSDIEARMAAAAAEAERWREALVEFREAEIYRELKELASERGGRPKDPIDQHVSEEEIARITAQRYRWLDAYQAAVAVIREEASEEDWGGRNDLQVAEAVITELNWEVTRWLAVDWIRDRLLHHDFENEPPPAPI